MLAAAAVAVAEAGVELEFSDEDDAGGRLEGAAGAPPPLGALEAAAAACEE